MRRGSYTLPETEPISVCWANHLVPGSYISPQIALAYYHLIPEHVAVVISITTRSPGKYENKYGRFSYRHIRPSLFFGFEHRLLVNDEYAYVAMPEKALLDLIHFRPQKYSKYIQSLRLQNLEILDLERLHLFAERSRKPTLKRAARGIKAIVRHEEETYQSL